MSRRHRVDRSLAASRGAVSRGGGFRGAAFRVGMAAAAFLLVASPTGRAAAQDREVADLEFRGNAAFEDGQLADAIATRATSCKSFLFQIFPFCPLTDWGFAHERHFLVESDLPADLLRLRLFYRRRGFRAVQVDTAVERTNGEVRITFFVDEGAPTLVDLLRIVGIEGILREAEVRENFPLREGGRLDLVALADGKQQVTDRLRNLGYVNAVALDQYFIPADSGGARVTVEVIPGVRARIGRVGIEGEGNIGEGVVRRFLTFQPGEWYRQDRILESQRALYSLEAVRFADIRSERSPSDPDSVVDLTVDIRSASALGLRTGVGVTTTDCVQTEARLTHRNFFGQARRLQVTGRLSNLLSDPLAGSFPCTGVGDSEVFQEVDFSLRADLRQPIFLSERNSLDLGLFLERETVPDIFVRKSRGGEVTVTRRLTERTPISLTYRPDLTNFAEESADIFFCVSFGFCRPEDIDVLTDKQWLSPLVLSWRTDLTDSPIAPSTGYYVGASLEGAGNPTVSDYQYLRFNLEAADFEPLGDRYVLAARIRAGVVEAVGSQPFDDPAGDGGGIIHPRKRFFAGGANSVRGFSQNLLGPTVLVLDADDDCPGVALEAGPLAECAGQIADDDPDAFDERPIGGDASFEANLELRRRVGDRWSVVGFLDVGQVWEDLDELESPVVTPGIGVRFASPVGPLRLDLGFDPTDADRLPVVAELEEGERAGEIIELPGRVTFDQFAFDDPSPFREFLRRIQIHISIGEAF